MAICRRVSERCVNQFRCIILYLTLSHYICLLHYVQILGFTQIWVAWRSNYKSNARYQAAKLYVYSEGIARAVRRKVCRYGIMWSTLVHRCYSISVSLKSQMRLSACIDVCTLHSHFPSTPVFSSPTTTPPPSLSPRSLSFSLALLSTPLFGDHNLEGNDTTT